MSHLHRLFILGQTLSWNFFLVRIGKLSPLTGALAIHEILIGSDLSIKKKHLPTDPFYKSVQIKESRKKSSVVTPLLDDDEEME